MSGCYGSDPEDRHFENKLINHLDREENMETKYKVEITIKNLPEDENEYEEMVDKACSVLEEAGFEVYAGIGEPQE